LSPERRIRGRDETYHQQFSEISGASPQPLGAEREKETLITKKEAANRLAISIRTLDGLADRGLV
jgi:hypothetical protein